MGDRRSAGGATGGDGEGKLDPLPNGKTRWSSYLAAGAVIGYSPRDIDDMTLWEFACCSEGYRKAHASEEPPPPPMGDDELADLGIVGF
ncbi:hypothetical protein ELH34_37445 [Rhizobium ruizarguesonis]|nr:hypothetical protein ELH34_37445 [Rhizobium ruizarguesonis]